MVHLDEEESWGSSSDGVVSEFADQDEELTSSNKRGNQNKAEESEILARQETNQVRRLRQLMILVLVMVTLGASAGIYWYSRRTEWTEFENEFAGQGFKVISGFEADSLRKLQAMDSLSKSLTGYAAATNATWPYVKIDNSANFLEPYLDLANAAALTIQPVVPKRQRTEWEVYSVANQEWIRDDLMYHQSLTETSSTATQAEYGPAAPIAPYIKNHVGVEMSPGNWVVWWQYAPIIRDPYYLNFNRLAVDGFRKEVQAVLNGRAQLSAMWSYVPGLDFQSTADFNFMNALLMASGHGSYQPGEPIGYIHYPVTTTKNSSDNDKEETVAVLTATVYWKSYFQDILPDTVKGIHAVVTNTLNQTFTYKISGRNAEFLGMEDLHDPQFDEYVVSADYATFGDEYFHSYRGVPLDDSYVAYRIHVYPSAELEAEYLTSKPLFYATGLFGVFVFTVLVFIAYDCYVERRQKIVLTTALQSTAVVSSLFPQQVRDRLYEQTNVAGSKAKQEQSRKASSEFARRHVLQSFLPNNQSDASSSDPIADFFPETTILFADIAGFTAWSSAREPKQVFILLETIYGAFDKIAKKRHVYKIETIGDCYVAVTGVPRFRQDHAILMARFAHDCMYKFGLLTKDLETTLGPDTGDLAMRVGIHSGPVTAGVLRGERARFQLFGDSMNTAARMEQTGTPGRVQISQQCADLLVESGKSNWITKREDLVKAKGKGDLQTYWLNVGTFIKSVGSAGNNDTGHASESAYDQDILLAMVKSHKFSQSQRLEIARKMEIERNNVFSDKSQRLIKWNVDVLQKLLCQMIARREASGNINTSIYLEEPSPASVSTILEEVKEIIILPEFDHKSAEAQRNGPSIKLSLEVEDQLQKFVSNIAAMYLRHGFHNFEHASHVTQSVTKLLARITESTESCSEADAATIHDRTYGIKSDPLTQFACVFSALIHDAAHPGVPNSQLIRENVALARTYKGRSVAEQNSVDLAWNLFMEDDFRDLRATICPSREEQRRFRQLVVNSVMATDIMDKELKKMRDERWNKAFCVSQDSSDHRKDMNRKATIVIEHLIQASDVAHTMQHWHVYRKWNENFFRECFRAYQDGRADRDPSANWYEGELGFFDFYIIPLAAKLKDCGVFGVSSDEYLNYAKANRAEWAAKGKQIVEEMVERLIQFDVLDVTDQPDASESRLSDFD